MHAADGDGAETAVWYEDMAQPIPNIRFSGFIHGVQNSGHLKRQSQAIKKTAQNAVFFRFGQLAFEEIAEFVVELVHATGGVHDFLLAGVEWMAQRANLDIEGVFFHSRFGHEFAAARAVNGYFVVVRVNTLFHLISFQLSGHRGFAYASRQAHDYCYFFLFRQADNCFRRPWCNLFASATV